MHLPFITNAQIEIHPKYDSTHLCCIGKTIISSYNCGVLRVRPQLRFFTVNNLVIRNYNVL